MGEKGRREGPAVRPTILPGVHTLLGAHPSPGSTTNRPRPRTSARRWSAGRGDRREPGEPGVRGNSRGGGFLGLRERAGHDRVRLRGRRGGGLGLGGPFLRLLRGGRLVFFGAGVRPPFLPSASNSCLAMDTRTRGAFLRVIEERRDAARQQPAPEETNEHEDVETPRRPPWLANKRRRAPWR